VERAELHRVASTIAHELRNPIAAIRALAQTGSRMYQSLSDDERREFFDLIDEEARRLSIVSEHASTALKIEARALAYDLRPESITGLIREVVERTPHGEHPLTIDVEEGLVASIDRVRVGDVLAQLVDNASKFSPPDAPILVRARRDDGRAVIEVEDRGPGIPEARREEVFGRFSHLRPPGYEEVPGSGLGLFISRAHVDAHGGSIAVDDAPGDGEAGTMLRVELPLER
jgi:signal transduction histidine kinase